MRLGPDCVAVERKSLSLYQYCRYPANSLNRLNLWATGSRDFRFCMRASRVLSEFEQPGRLRRAPSRTSLTRKVGRWRS